MLVTQRQRGAGLLSSSFGLLFFLGFLTLATQVTVALFATSAAGAIAAETARSAAAAIGTAGATCDVAMTDSARRSIQQLSGQSGRMRFDAQCLGPDLQIQVAIDKPTLLKAVGSHEITRTAVVRTERLIETGWQ